MLLQRLQRSVHRKFYWPLIRESNSVTLCADHNMSSDWQRHSSVKITYDVIFRSVFFFLSFSFHHQCQYHSRLLCRFCVLVEKLKPRKLEYVIPFELVLKMFGEILSKSFKNRLWTCVINWTKITALFQIIILVYVRMAMCGEFECHRCFSVDDGIGMWCIYAFTLIYTLMLDKYEVTHTHTAVYCGWRR